MDGTKKRILLVEDESMVAEVFVLLLTDEGYEVECLPKVAGVFEKVRANPPDLLLVDLPPHPSTARRVVDMLRTDASTSHLPLLVMATEQSILGKLAEPYNIQGALLMPFELEDLLDAVEEALEHSVNPRPAPPPRTDASSHPASE